MDRTRYKRRIDNFMQRCLTYPRNQQKETVTELQWDLTTAGFFCGSGYSLLRTTHTHVLMETDTPKETAAPGDWEITNETAVETTAEEEQQENENTENGVTKEILKALDDLPGLMEEV